ncbi:radical SAM protein [Actinocorallia lasiicapitis]
MEERPVESFADWMAELEITRTCELRCTGCYNNSGPRAGTGGMKTSDWLTVIDEAADLGIGTIQLIGGEPTSHPDLGLMIQRALIRGRRVIVFSHLADVPDALWPYLIHPEVSLATSWYSTDPAVHDAITRTPGSHAATLAGIKEAVARGITVRGRVVDYGQDAVAAAEQLRALGLTDVRIGSVRDVGRASRNVAGVASPSCGMCGIGRLAIDTDGKLMPCVLGGRHLKAGDVRDHGLARLLHSTLWEQTLEAVERPQAAQGCPPADSNDCNPAV